ncbi:asparagine synthase (glutamine-hydrolyzing) [Chryseolinea soli]|uniref:asparagine synthase (glutamine-hydrolyzing) n=1 Tax=Chryseolinea soli TaxID=2321403 RepID=A0A385SQ92_9BACT|nr:asparagine synthase (glutamine-hydrolyzing) [Chryseolinea soli]AYB33164.1 asparagine synthase (glutamine-hydrolyzing) [Chryseolinea soli]
MCGIVGFCDFNKRSNADVLQKMTQSLHHRGPDDSGTFFEEQSGFALGFGHTRLSILDLSPLGHQPMRVGKMVITFNGEVYNFMEIRERLEKEGCTFKSHSDTEMILYAFQQWGPSCLQYFRGMFAFTLYDEEKQKLYVVRDRVGVKPLYYYHKDNTFLFSSTLKPFHMHPAFHKEVDMASLGLFLQYSYIPGPHCIFKHTQKLLPGHYLEISLTNRDIKLHKYWDVVDAYNQPKLDVGDEEAIRETEKILSESFNYRMVADVPVGIFLSGGFDSSAVAALIQKDRTDRLKTFTIGFDVPGFDEAPDARKIAKHLGTDHTEYYCSPKDAFDIIPNLPDIYDEPFADNSSVPSVLVSQLARKQVTVALSGDGGDEIFAGYNKFSQSIKYANGYPQWVKRSIAKTMGIINPDHIPVLNQQYNFSTRYEKMKHILQSNDPSDAMNIISQYIPQQEVKRLVAKEYKDYKTFFDLKEEFAGHNDALSKMLGIDYKTFLNDNNLVKIDRATMSVGLEGREPFLDQKVIEYVSRLPSHLKLRDGVTKYILKQIVYKHIPRELMDRPKKPFIAPLTVWFMNELKDFFLNYLDEGRIRREGLLNAEPILAMRNQYLSGKKVNHQKLWNLLIFEMWMEKWMK